MKPTPIHIIIAQLKGKQLHEQIYRLQAELRKERLYSIRWNEIRSLLQGKMLKKLRREERAA